MACLSWGSFRWEVNIYSFLRSLIHIHGGVLGQIVSWKLSCSCGSAFFPCKPLHWLFIRFLMVVNFQNIVRKLNEVHGLYMPNFGSHRASFNLYFIGQGSLSGPPKFKGRGHGHHYLMGN